MPWTEITRAKYRREGSRHASDMTDAEWSLIAPMMPKVNWTGRLRETDPAGGDERDPLHGRERLPVAAVAEGISALFDGTAVFLPLAA